MIFIFGGAYQGKLEYALTRLPSQTPVWQCGFDDYRTPAGPLINGLHKWLWALLAAGEDPDMALSRAIESWGESIIICDDICGGVVPLDPLERQWREAVGRGMAKLARSSAQTVRMFCGLPTVL